MRFFVSATNEAGDDWIAKEIEAECFEDALGLLRELARRRWAGQCSRLTSVTQCPDQGRTGPINLAFTLGRAA